ncbi:RHS repeat-associated protein [Erwinia toletana]|uniref:RHS repeat-associated protein n=1 Tax=Winslowiella toletana TaxID=92490 RepID=A0ABS4P7Y0_9GAMM|nr:RHS repeat-associated core domain-containing protein [Winslowiella toletana]MBP2168747.1 RHS repeat-associated protein [Winslowiella toletana]
MADKVAARIDDPLVHSSLLSDFVSGMVEGAIYAGILLACSAMTLSGVGLVLGIGLTIAAIADGFPERLGNAAGGAVDSLIGALGLTGPPDAVITSGSGNVHIMGKPAARAAGTVDHAFLNAPAGAEEEGPSAWEIAAGMAAGIASTVAHPGAFFSALGEKISNVTASDVGDFFSNLWKDISQPTVASASPHSTPASMDTVACTKHSGPIFIAKGSKKVLINGQPAARSGDLSTCEAKIDVAEDPRVRIGGESIVVQDIRSGKNFFAWFIGGMLGGGELKQVLQLMGKAFDRVMARKLLRSIPCPIVAAGASMAVSQGAVAAAAGVAGVASNAVQTPHPVNIATGAKILAGAEDLDFALEDRIPLYWQRVYHSRNLATGMLGQGWMLPFESRLIRYRAANGELHFRWRDLVGRELEMGEVRPGDVIQFAEDGITLYCTLEGVVVLQTSEGEHQLYEPDPTREGEWRIARIYDRHDNCQHLSWNEAGQLIAIAGDNEAMAVELSYESVHGRLATVHQRAAGERYPLVRYGYNDQGQLISVTDADEVTTRRFSWDRASDMLASHSYATGLTVSYDWQPAADSTFWRVISYQVRDDQQQILESWIIDSDEQARNATVTCLSGGSTFHQWDAQYRITGWTDMYGAEWHYEWADQGEQLQATSGPDGERWEYGYDQRGNLTVVRNPLGETRLTVWHPVWSQPQQEVLADGASWRYQHNALGDVVAVTDPQGGVTQLEWNPQGDLVAETDALGNVRRFWWNERGQMVSDEDCSGYRSHQHYDATGRLLSATDAEGNTTSCRWSRAGRIEAIIRADNRETRYEYDAHGQLAGENIDGFSERKLQRNVRGQVICQTDPAGHHTRFDYDRFGRLTRLINPNNDSWQFDWDSGERLLAQTDYAGRRKSYGYDDRGQVTSVSQQPLAQNGEQQAPLVSQLEYDLLGRLTAKSNGETYTRYQYAARSVTLQRTTLAEHHAARQKAAEPEWDDQLSFTLDALGNLQNEQNHGGRWQYQYDALGNLQQSQGPDGTTQSFLRYGSGHLLQRNWQRDGQQADIAAYARDRLHREISRSQGPLTLETAYDPAGRIIKRRSAVLERRYQWDRLDQVAQQMLMSVEKNDSRPAFSQQRFGYDAAGQVTHRIGAEREERFHYDPAGNRTDTAGQVVWHNLLRRLKGARWEYDGFGRLLWRKAEQGAVEQHFSYNAEHQVTEVRLSGHREYQRVQYRYDALGRRTHKILHRHGQAETDAEIITFHWQGLQMAGEQSSRSPDHSVQYLYNEGGWEPLARVDIAGDSQQTLWYHTDLNGLPERLTDEGGEVVWQGRFSSWGETERETHAGQLAVPQNLRFQGQYLDRETGLHYNLFRYYDPVAGRFTQPDPIGLAGGINLYAYAPNPLNWIDPLGLKCQPEKWDVSSHQSNKSAVKGKNLGLDSHHVGQKNIMKDLVEGYDPATAPAMLVPRVGHTVSKEGVGIVSRSQINAKTGLPFANARDVVARDIWELRRVYPEIPNSKLQELIDMNKVMYPEIR